MLRRVTMREKWKSITRDDLFKRMSEKPSVLRKEDIKLAATSILEQLSQALCVGQRIELRGFGSFALRYYICESKPTVGNVTPQRRVTSR